MQERQPEYPSVVDAAKEQRKRHFLRIIASTLDGHMFNFTLAKNQKDAQDLAEEIRKAVHEKLTERAALFAPRERSFSIEPDDFNSFMALDGLTTKVEDLLANDDPKIRQAARVVIPRNFNPPAYCQKHCQHLHCNRGSRVGNRGSMVGNRGSRVEQAHLDWLTENMDEFAGRPVQWLTTKLNEHFQIEPSLAQRTVDKAINKLTA
ncbi:MAG: hypothetical protein J3R72DRAFT_505063 [Linnemannia gamsii]|nr:MAG: hypothetical protein J3R72DRAFT_505063 [Linnemannia gamsii]